jgi:hypothetical protein
VFRIGDIHFNESQPNGMDFRIAAAGPEDVVVQFVRVLKMEPPQRGPSQREPGRRSPLGTDR